MIMREFQSRKRYSLIKLPIGFTNITSSTASANKLVRTRDLRESETESLGLNMLLILNGGMNRLYFQSCSNGCMYPAQNSLQGVTFYCFYCFISIFAIQIKYAYNFFKNRCMHDEREPKEANKAGE